MLTCICGETKYGRPKIVHYYGQDMQIASCQKCGLVRDLKVYDHDSFYSSGLIYKAPSDKVFDDKVRSMGRYVDFISKAILIPRSSKN